VREGSDAAFLLRTFFDKLGQGSLRDVALVLSAVTGITDVYPPALASVFEGSDATFFGRYATPGRGTATVRGHVAGQTSASEVSSPIALPDHDATRPWVARGWARLRIDDLLDRIAEGGEKPEWVREVIALAKEFHFVTPYTSFIAASRALLRPRVIQPGDPVLRVKTSRDIREVVAVFPFGLTQSLAYLPADDVWQTRFLAPTWMVDGAYECLLVLTDLDGKKIEEHKSFVIDSKPPAVRASLAASSVSAGGEVGLTVHADADTRRISARIGDGPAIDVTWDGKRKASFGTLRVPRDLPTGRATVTIVAEDMAHNLASAELPLDVIAVGGGL
jgi:Ca-activated chloride channel family protein